VEAGGLKIPNSRRLLVELRFTNRDRNVQVKETLLRTHPPTTNT
jgi:hypothetical protein